MTNRLEYLRQEIRNETISTQEILELETLAEAGEIDPNDVELLQWANVQCECCNN